MIVAIIGEGQLAQCIAQEFPGETAIIGHARLDIVTKRGFEILDDLDPDVIVNTAAFHDLKGCEEDMAKAVDVNYHGAINLCDKADEMGVKLIHIGTDYAYQGYSKPIPESADMRPANVYGTTKTYGMQFVLEQGHTVVNIAALWSQWPSRAKGSNFVLSMTEKAQKGQKAQVVDDLITSFTYGPHAAKAIRFIIGKPAALYNAVNSGYASWFDFARAIYVHTGGNPSDVFPTQYDDTPCRPTFSVLSNKKLEKMGCPIPTWEESLTEYFNHKPRWEVLQ